MAQTIFNKFLFYKTVDAFEDDRDAEAFSPNSIVFVGQEKNTETNPALDEVHFIYTHGRRFDTDFDPATINAAIEALDGRLDTLEAGDTVSGSVAYAVKTLSDTIMGLLGNGFDTTNTVTKKVSDNTSAIATLNGDNTTAGSVAKSIKDAIDALDFTEVDATATGEAIVKVSETNGVVSATKGDIAAAHVTVADSGDKFTATTVEAVLAEIDTAYKAAIAALDFTDTPAVKKVVTGVSEENGVISVSRKELKSTDKTVTITQATTSDDIDFAVNIDGTTILKDANTGVLSVASSALVQYVGDGKTVAVGAESNGEKQISTTIKIAEVTTGLNSNVEQAWDLVDANGDVITGSSRIIVKKDNSFINGKIGHVDDTINASTGAITDGTGNAAIDLIYKNNEGNYVLITVDIEQYLKEAEFKDGLAVNNHQVSVKLSSNTESAKYLKIQAITGENGAIELSGIDAAIAAASSSIASKTTGHVTVSSASDANGTVYTISESDIASDAALTAEVTRAKSAETAIDGAIGLTKGADNETRTWTNTTNYNGGSTATVKANMQAIDTQVKTNTDAIATLDGAAIKSIKVNNVDATVSSNAATVTIDGADIKLDGYTKGSDDTAVAATDTINAALGKLENQIDDAEAAAKSYADDITVNGQSQTSQEITIDGGDINVTGYDVKTGAGTGDVAATDTVNAAIKKVETKVDSLTSGSPFVYSNSLNKSTVLKNSNLTAQNESEVAVGKYNVSTSAKTQFSVGIGVANAQKNGFEVQNDGTIIIYPYKTTNNVKSFNSTSAILQEILSNEIDWYEGD